MPKKARKKYVLVCFGCHGYFTGFVSDLYCKFCDAIRGGKV